MSVNTEIQWTACWTDAQGRTRELLFYGPQNRGIACIDFKWLLLSMKEPVPAHFEIEEATLQLPALRPWKAETPWRQQ